MLIEIDQEESLTELARLRNRHVAKLLTFLGQSTPPYIEQAIKRSMSMFESDIAVNILDREPQEVHHLRENL